MDSIGTGFVTIPTSGVLPASRCKATTYARLKHRMFTLTFSRHHSILAVHDAGDAAPKIWLIKQFCAAHAYLEFSPIHRILRIRLDGIVETTSPIWSRCCDLIWEDARSNRAQATELVWNGRILLIIFVVLQVVESIHGALKYAFKWEIGIESLGS